MIVSATKAPSIPEHRDQGYDELREEVATPIASTFDGDPGSLVMHRAAVKRLQCDGVSGLEFAWLPTYVPELNPVELLWDWSKYRDLTNDVPDETSRLQAVVQRSLSKPKADPQLKRSCFHAAELRL